jgi:hypothetical protein
MVEDCSNVASSLPLLLSSSIVDTYSSLASLQTRNGLTNSFSMATSKDSSELLKESIELQEWKEMLLFSRLLLDYDVSLSDLWLSALNFCIFCFRQAFSDLRFVIF